MVAKGDSLAEILDSCVLLVEEQSSGVLAYLLIGSEWQAVAPRRRRRIFRKAIRTQSTALSSAPLRLMRNSRIPRRTGQCVRHCGRSVAGGFSRLGFGTFRACWSTPIFSSDGKVIGTFAVYYREPRSPTPRQQETIKHITYLAGMAIQRKLAERARRESEAYFAKREQAQPYRELGLGPRHWRN